MVVFAQLDWTPVLVALATGVPAIIAAILSARIRRDIRTGNGRTIGQSVEDSTVAGEARGEAASRIAADLREHREVTEPPVVEPT